jgi:hypothetical protein
MNIPRHTCDDRLPAEPLLREEFALRWEFPSLHFMDIKVGKKILYLIYEIPPLSDLRSPIPLNRSSSTHSLHENQTRIRAVDLTFTSS